jgi:hypothetical protein
MFCGNNIKGVMDKRYNSSHLQLWMNFENLLKFENLTKLDM